MKTLAMIAVVFFALVGLAVPANAQTPTQGLDVNVTVLGHAGIVTGSSSEHFLTFSGPVGVPGVGLTAGSYIFRFVAPSLMQVLSDNRSIVYAMFFVSSIARGEVTHDYALTLRRPSPGAPARIATMFFPEATTGYELMYPTTEIAAGVGQVAMK